MPLHLEQSKLDPPKEEQGEISIFGTGCGECIVIHLGFNEWAIFDCCLNPRNSAPAALEYLTTIGVNVSESVKFFLISHWHDDHIKGAADLYTACKNSAFCCYDALKEQQFIELALTAEHPHMDASNLTEFARIIREKERRSSLKDAISIFKWATADKRLFSTSKSARTFHSEIYSLSPSDSVKTAFLTRVAGLFPKVKNGRNAIIDPVPKPNDTSVVAWVAIGNVNILLGADLENSADQAKGWKAILHSNEKPSGKAKIFKIPHHGSSNAFNAEIWKKLIDDDPISLISPFNAGRKSLPSPSDISRLCDLSPETYCTNEPRISKPKRRSRTVERTMGRIAKRRQIKGGKYGHVRVRFDPLGDLNPQVALIGTALLLCSSSQVVQEDRPRDQGH